MYLTIENLEEIESFLQKRAIKDTQFPVVSSLYEEDFIPIIQSGRNKIISFKDFINEFKKYMQEVDIKEYILPVATDEILGGIKVPPAVTTTDPSNIYHSVRSSITSVDDKGNLVTSVGYKVIDENVKRSMAPVSFNVSSPVGKANIEFNYLKDSQAAIDSIFEQDLHTGEYTTVNNAFVTAKCLPYLKEHLSKNLWGPRSIGDSGNPVYIDKGTVKVCDKLIDKKDMLIGVAVKGNSIELDSAAQADVFYISDDAAPFRVANIIDTYGSNAGKPIGKVLCTRGSNRSYIGIFSLYGVEYILTISGNVDGSNSVTLKHISNASDTAAAEHLRFNRTQSSDSDLSARMYQYELVTEKPSLRSEVIRVTISANTDHKRVSFYMFNNDTAGTHAYTGQYMEGGVLHNVILYRYYTEGEERKPNTVLLELPSESIAPARITATYTSDGQDTMAKTKWMFEEPEGSTLFKDKRSYGINCPFPYIQCEFKPLVNSTAHTINLYPSGYTAGYEALVPVMTAAGDSFTKLYLIRANYVGNTATSPQEQFSVSITRVNL